MQRIPIICRMQKTIIMTSTIDDLFEKIIHSEKAAQNRKNYLNELRQELQTSARNVEGVNEECRRLHAQLSTKLQEFSKEELNAKWLTSQEGIYKQQRDERRGRIDALKTKLKSLENELTNEKKNFCRELEEFSLTFDLNGSGQTRREAEYKQQIQHMAEQESQLKKELLQYTTKKSTTDALLAQQETLQQGLEQLTKNNTKLLADLHEQMRKTSELEEQKVSVSNYVQTDPEFCSLERELCEVRQSCPEDTCSRLQEQYQQLQHARWQKHVHARQQQQQHLQQQQLMQQQVQQKEEEYSSEVLSEMFDSSDDIEHSDSAMDSQGDHNTPSGSQTEGQLPTRKLFRPKLPRLSLSNDTSTTK